MFSGKLFLYLSIEVFGLFKLHREKTPSLYLFQVSGDENVGKKDCHFFGHCGILCLKIILTLKWKGFFLIKISLSISLRELVCGYGRFA